MAAICKKVLNVLVLAGTGMLAVTSAAPAATDIDNFALSPEQLFNATVISASRTSEKLMDAPAAIYVLTNEDIIRSGATSIPDALRLVPGVYVAQTGANSWAVSVRGFSASLADKLLVLIDGREVYDPLFAGVYWDVQDTILEDIDRIEVVRGPGATLWGANAVNGVINIITKKAGDTQGNLVSVTAGTQPRTVVEERYGGKFSDDGFFRVYGKYVSRNHEETLSGGDPHDAQDMKRAGFRADWGSSGDSFTLQGDAYTSLDGNLRAVPDLGAAGFNRVVNENIFAEGGNVLGRWSRPLSGDSRVTVQGYLDYAARSQIVVDDTRLNFDLDAQYEFPTYDQHKIIAGLGYRYSVDALEGSYIASFTHDGDRTQIFSGFIQDKITLEPKGWFLTLGSKFEHNDFTGFEIQPSARLQWHPDEQQMVWTSVSRAVRRPNRLENDFTINQAYLSLGGLPAELRLVPNRDVESERMTAYEIGYRNQITPTLLLDVTGFYNDYSNLATLSFLTPDLSGLPFLFPILTTNATEAQTRGLETLVNWRALDNLNLSAAHTLLAMHLSGPDGNHAVNSMAAEHQSPSQQFNLRSQWDVTDNAALDTTLYYVGNVPGLNVEEYWRFDTRFNWRMFDGVQLTLVGQNLFDDQHHEFSSSRIGRSFYGNVTWRY